MTLEDLGFQSVRWENKNGVVVFLSNAGTWRIRILVGEDVYFWCSIGRWIPLFGAGETTHHVQEDLFDLCAAANASLKERTALECSGSIRPAFSLNSEDQTSRCEQCDQWVPVFSTPNEMVGLRLTLHWIKETPYGTTQINGIPAGPVGPVPSGPNPNGLHGVKPAIRRHPTAG